MYTKFVQLVFDWPHIIHGVFLLNWCPLLVSWVYPKKGLFITDVITGGGFGPKDDGAIHDQPLNVVFGHGRGWKASQPKLEVNIHPLFR